jgi:hypothetical protein
MDLIQITMLQIAPKTADIWKKFTKYFIKTWINGYKPQEWNSYEGVRSVNNGLERYNRTFNELFPTSKPPAIKFLDILRNEVCRISDLLESINGQHSVQKTRVDPKPIILPEIVLNALRSLATSNTPNFTLNNNSIETIVALINDASKKKVDEEVVHSDYTESDVDDVLFSDDEVNVDDVEVNVDDVLFSDQVIEYDDSGKEIGTYWQTEDKLNDWFEDYIVADKNQKIELKSKKGKGLAYKGDCCKKHIDNSKLVGCDGYCNGWYHDVCVGGSVISDDPTNEWMCMDCSKISVKVTSYMRDTEVVILKCGGQALNVTQKDFNRLKPSVWINDQIINAYGYLLNHNDVMIMNTFFFTGWENGFEKWYQTRTQWRNETNFLGKRVVIFPINLSNTHWVLCWIDVNAKQVLYYDAKGSRDKTFLEVIPIN